MLIAHLLVICSAICSLDAINVVRRGKMRLDLQSSQWRSFIGPTPFYHSRTFVLNDWHSLICWLWKICIRRRRVQTAGTMWYCRSYHSRVPMTCFGKCGSPRRCRGFGQSKRLFFYFSLFFSHKYMPPELPICVAEKKRNGGYYYVIAKSGILRLARMNCCILTFIE